MRVLIIIEHSRKKRFLVSLQTERLAEEVRGLVNRGQNSQAIVTALSKGRLEGKVAYDKPRGLAADLVLSEENARWDITDKK